MSNKSNRTTIRRKASKSTNQFFLSIKLLTIWICLCIFVIFVSEISEFRYIYEYLHSKIAYDSNSQNIFSDSDPDSELFWGITDSDNRGVWMSSIRYNEDQYLNKEFTFYAKLMKVYEEKYSYRYELAILEYSGLKLSTDENTIYVKDSTKDGVMSKYNSWNQDDSQVSFKITGTFTGKVEGERTTRTLHNDVLKFDATSIEQYNAGVGESAAELIDKSHLFRNYSSTDIDAELSTALDNSSTEQRYCVLDGIIASRETLSSDYSYYSFDVDGQEATRGVKNIQVFLNNLSNSNLYAGEKVRLKGEMYGANHLGTIFVYVYEVEELPRDYEFNHGVGYSPNKCILSNKDYHTVYYDKSLKKYNNGSTYVSKAVFDVNSSSAPSNRFVKKIENLYANSIHDNIKKYIESDKPFHILMQGKSATKEYGYRQTDDAIEICVQEGNDYLPSAFIEYVGRALYTKLSEGNLSYYTNYFDRYVVLEYAPFYRAISHDVEYDNSAYYFTCAYISYVQHPDVLKKYCPNTYRYMNNLVIKLGE